jgi:hypothetical protein
MQHSNTMMPATALAAATSIGGSAVTWVDTLDAIVRIGAGILSAVASVVLVAYTIYQWRKGK